MQADWEPARPRPAVSATMVVLALVAATAGCVPGPSREQFVATGARALPSAGPSAMDAAPDLPGVPAMLLAGPTGLAVTGPGRPTDHLVLALPPGAWQPTAAVGSRGAILLVSAPGASPATVLEGVLTGTRVATRWTAVLPLDAGPLALPGCVGADGSATIIADRLVYLRGGRVAGSRDVPATAGRCQMADDDGVLYLAEEDHALAVWRPPADTAVVTATRCDDFALGGALLACLVAGNDDVLVGRVVMPVSGRAAFDPATAQRPPGPVRQAVLSADGRWLALIGPDAGPVRLLRRGSDGVFAAAGAFGLALGEEVLGFVEP